MSVAYTFAEALARAGEDPTRESLVEALESGEVVGNGIVPLGFGKDSRRAFGGVGITVVSGGVQDYVGEVYTTDTGDGDVVVYDGEAVALENDGIPQS